MKTHYLVHHVNMPGYERRMLFIAVRARRLFSETTLTLIIDSSTVA